MIKIAIIGAGKIAEKFHLPSLKKIKNVKDIAVSTKGVINAEPILMRRSGEIIFARLLPKLKIPFCPPDPCIFLMRKNQKSMMSSQGEN